MDDKRAQKMTLLMVLLTAYATPLMLSAVNVALPNIARDLSLDAVTLSWIPTIYLMASAMFIPVFGMLADLYGRKRFFLGGVVCIVLSSVLASAAINGWVLIGARFLQGVSAAMLYATQIAIVSALFLPAQRGRMIGLTLSMTYIGLASGPLLGGALVDAFGWRASFLLHVPLLLFALLIACVFVKSGSNEGKKGRFDGRGALLYCVSILCFSVSIILLPDLVAALFFVTSTILAVSLFRHAYRAPQPLFDVHLFYTNRTFFFSCLAALLAYTASYANIVLVSLYLQYIQAMSATAAGLILLTQPLTIAFLSPIAGRLSDRFEPKIIASTGLLFVSIGLLMLALLDADNSLFFILLALVLTGFGLGFFTSPNTNTIMAIVKRDYYSRAASAVSLMRILGQMSSMLLVTLIFTLIIGDSEAIVAADQGLLQAIKHSFIIAFLLCLLGLFFSLQRGRIYSSKSA